MKAAIFTLDTESYKARKASAAGMVFKETAGTVRV